ncbi:MAG: hypothetical protein IJX36_07320, partial [Thermoguttaceae bacterium]|nr:hypothetical protein [Thermoguttaceae bacterium]
ASFFCRRRGATSRSAVYGLRDATVITRSSGVFFEKIDFFPKIRLLCALQSVIISEYVADSFATAADAVRRRDQRKQPNTRS